MVEEKKFAIVNAWNLISGSLILLFVSPSEMG